MAATVQQVDASWEYLHADAVKDDLGRMFFLVPERPRFQEREDTIAHYATGQERVWDLAILYYGQIVSNPLDYWPYIALFQPAPIQNPLLPLPAEEVVLIPSMDWIEQIKAASLMDAPAL